jgi:peptidoglycan LD-endopeptidase LytH
VTLQPVPAAAVARDDGATAFLAHTFPVSAPHYERGAIGEFGAPRSGGRRHEGFDVVAGCGAPLVAAATGRVRRRGFDPVLYGNYLLIQGAGERRSYFYSHLRRPAAVVPGEAVWTGQRVGAVGKTGNARTVGCHLHFEVHIRGRPIDPEPLLHRWDRLD